MAIHVLCPRCNARYSVENDRAGKTAACPACGSVARIPDVGAAAGTPAPDPGAGTFDPHRSPQYPTTERTARRRSEAAARVAGRVRAVAILNLVVGALNLMWGLLMIAEAFVFSAGMIPQEPGGPPQEFMVGFCAVLAVLCLGTALIEVLAGLFLLLEKRNARGWGIAAGAISCMSLWTCCVAFFCVPVGIYTLVVLCGRDAREASG